MFIPTSRHICASVYMSYVWILTFSAPGSQSENVVVGLSCGSDQNLLHDKNTQLWSINGLEKFSIYSLRNGTYPFLLMFPLLLTLACGASPPGLHVWPCRLLALVSTCLCHQNGMLGGCTLDHSKRVLWRRPGEHAFVAVSGVGEGDARRFPACSPVPSGRPWDTGLPAPSW